MTTDIKIGLVGAGLIGREHAEYCGIANGVELAGIADPSPESAETAHKYGVSHFTDYGAMFRSGDVQAVIAAVPNAMHTDVALAAMAAGLPVLVEKPLAESLEAGQRIVHESAETGVPVLVGHQRRYAPDIAAAKAFIDEGGVGEVVSVSILSTWRKNEEYFQAPWRTAPGAGPVLINLIHDIDAIRYLVGDIEDAVSLGSSTARGFQIADTVGAVMRFANGAIGTALASDAAVSPWCWDLTSGYGAYFPDPPAGDVYFISGTEASISLPSLTVSRHEGSAHWQVPLKQTTLPRVEVNPYVAQLEHFGAVARREATPLITAADALQSLKVALSIDSSSDGPTTRKVSL